MAQGIKGSTPPCGFPGCPNPHKGHGYCATHLNRVRRFGDPNVDLSMDGRFWLKVSLTDNPPCWQWTAARNKYGYAIYRSRQASRWAYERFVGPIPPGHQVHHECHNRLCVNPDHLTAVTPAQHAAMEPGRLSTINARKTHCINGHPFDSENTYVTPDGRRKCRTCMRQDRRNSRARAKQRRMA